MRFVASTSSGVGQGKNYAINFPLADGINDESYRSIFRPVIEKVLACALGNLIFASDPTLLYMPSSFVAKLALQQYKASTNWSDPHHWSFGVDDSGHCCTFILCPSGHGALLAGGNRDAVRG